MVRRTDAELQTQINTLLPDNTTGDISAADVRSVDTDFVDSKVSLDDGVILTTDQTIAGEKTFSDVVIANDGVRLWNTTDTTAGNIRYNASWEFEGRNGTDWVRLDQEGAVSSVFTRTGNVVAQSGDYNTTQVTEWTNLYYTEARVNANANVVANTAKVSADGSVTTHSDVTSAGSGQIITSTERSNIAWSVTVHSDVSNAGSGQIITATERTNITGSVTVHSDVSSAGSGQIITAAERTNLGNAALVNTANTFTAAQTFTTTRNSAGLETNVQAGTAYTLVLSDAWKTILSTSGSAVTITVPTNASVAFPIGTVIIVIQTGAGQVTFAWDSGVTVVWAGGNTSLSAQITGAFLQKTSTNAWIIIGSLA